MIRSDYDFREDNFDIFLAPRLTSQLIIFVRVVFFFKNDNFEWAFFFGYKIAKKLILCDKKSSYEICLFDIF